MSDTFTVNVSDTPNSFAVNVEEFPNAFAVSIAEAQDGITPQLIDNGDGLSVSYDNGESFNQLVAYQTIIDAATINSSAITDASSAFVMLSGDQTVAGAKTFTGLGYHSLEIGEFVYIKDQSGMVLFSSEESFLNDAGGTPSLLWESREFRDANGNVVLSYYGPNLQVNTNLVVTGTVSASNLTNVNNTSDASKPVSTATQTALNLKANLSGGNTFSGDQIFSSTTRPTSAGTGTPAASSLVTRADVDTRVWQPSMIQGLTAWFSAYDLLVQGTATPTDGSAVTTWRSKRGDTTITQATAGAKPLFKTNIQNGLPGVLFDGVNDCLQSPATPLFPNFFGPNQRTVFIVCKPTALVSTGGGTTYQRPQIFGNLASSNGIAVSPSGSNNIFTVWDYDTIGNVSASTPSIAPNSTVLITTRHLDGVTSISLNQGTPATASVLRECLSNSQLQFGTGGSYASFFTGYIFDVLFYNRALTNDEILAVENSLKLRYGI